MTVAIAPKAATGQVAGAREQRSREAPPRLAGADALRAGAALAVVAVHAAPWMWQATGPDKATWHSVTLLVRFSVPAFVLLTGLVLAYRYGDERLGAAFLWKRARRSVVPWLIWAPVFCVTDLLYVNSLDASGAAVRDWWLSGGGHLYFLLLIPQFYLLLMLWPSGRKAAMRVAVGAVVVQTALQVVRLVAPMPGVLRPLVLGHGFLEFPFWVGYFAVGVALGRSLAQRRGRGWSATPFAIAVPIAVAALLWVDVSGAVNATYANGTGAFLRPLVLPLTLALCGLLLFGAPRVVQRRRWMERTVSSISRHSLGIYIVHPLLLTVFARVVFRNLEMHVPLSALVFVALTGVTAASALAMSHLLARTPLAPIIGEHRIIRRSRDERELLGRRAAQGSGARESSPQRRSSASTSAAGRRSAGGDGVSAVRST